MAKEFEAQIVVIRNPAAMAPGYTPVYITYSPSSDNYIKFLAKIDPKTGGTVEEKPKFLKTGDAESKDKTSKAMAIETFKEFPEIGRFALRAWAQLSLPA